MVAFAGFENPLQSIRPVDVAEDILDEYVKALLMDEEVAGEESGLHDFSAQALRRLLAVLERQYEHERRSALVKKSRL